MSIVAPELPGARVADLFAGSGALGLEALSRGAVSADFVELAAGSLDALRANIAALGAGPTGRRVHRGDALRFAERLAPGAYDLVVRRSALQHRCRRAAGRALPPDSVRAHSFGRASRRPRAARATIPAATAIPLSPSSGPHDPHRDLPRFVRPADPRARGPDPAEPGPRRPADRRGGHQRLEAAALLGGRAAGDARGHVRRRAAHHHRVVRGAAGRSRPPGRRRPWWSAGSARSATSSTSSRWR